MKTNKFKSIKLLRVYFWIIIFLMIPFSNGCAVFQYQLRPPIFRPSTIETIQVTAYCACGKCCGWERNWRGQKVYSYGPHKGEPKIVGLTASGTWAKKGTIAADTNIFPLGTIMYIKGYGYGVVKIVVQPLWGIISIYSLKITPKPLIGETGIWKSKSGYQKNNI